MTHTPLVLRLFEAFQEKTPPPPPRLPQLPEAKGKTARIGYRLVYVIPRRPPKPEALAQLQARAARLRQPRPPRLDRPQLHAHHEHPRLPAYFELAGSYIFGESPSVIFSPPSPFERQAIAAHLDRIDRRIAPHRWGHRWRVDDVRHALGIDTTPRSW